MLTYAAERNWLKLKDEAASTETLEVLRRDQIQAWTNGQCVPAEAYLQQFPDLSTEDKLVLIMGEVLLRSERGEYPGLDEYSSRFPEWKPDLAIQFELLRPFDSTIDHDGSNVTLDNSTLSERSHDEPPRVEGYEIQERLGAGGMGVVWKAIHHTLNRTVALKMVLGGRVAAPRELSRFLAEAEAIAAIDHPNVVRIFDVGKSGGSPYIAMEYLPGGSLSDRLKQQTRLAPQEAASLVQRIAAAVQAAHDRQIVHRDLKPANILFDAAGSPKLTDFGLAKKAGQDLTHTRAILGTPAYMAPEQARGDSKFVGPQADIWSLGVILFECLTGKKPFSGSDEFEVIKRVVELEPGSLRSHAAEIPGDLELITKKCLAKEPLLRYTSAAALAQDLQEWQQGRPISVRAPRLAERGFLWIRRNRIAAAVIACSLLGALFATILAVWAWQQQQRADDSAGAARIAEQQAKASEQATMVELARTNRLLDILKMNQAETLFERNAVEPARSQWREIPGPLRNFAWTALGRHLEGSQWAHYTQSIVLSCAWKPGSPHIVIGCADGSLRILHATSGETVVAFAGHGDSISAVAWSNDGAMVVSAGWDGIAKLWNAATGALIRQFSGHSHAIRGIAIHPQGQLLATASADRTVQIWDLQSGDSKVILKGHTDSVDGVTWHPNGREIATASHDRSVRLWNAATGKQSLEWTGHSDKVYCLAWSPDGRTLASGGKDQTVRIWSATSRFPLRELRGHTHDVKSLAWRPDSRTLASTGFDRTVRIWDPLTGTPVRELKGHAYSVEAMTWSADGNTLATAAADHSLRFWKPSGMNDGEELTGHVYAVHQVKWSPDGTRLMTCSTDQTAVLWDAGSGRKQTTLKPGNEFVMACAWSPDGRQVATGEFKGRIIVWDAARGTKIREWKAHDGTISALAWNPDGSLLASSGQDRRICLWAADPTEPIRILAGHAHHVHDLAWSRDGQSLASASADQTVRIWNASNGATTREIRGHTHGVTSLAWSPDQQSLATGSGDQSLRVWDVSTGECRMILKGHTDTVSSVAWSPDATMIASGSPDQTIRLWDLKSRQVLKELKAPRGVTSLAWNSQGSRLVAAAGDGTVRIWGRALSPVLAELTGHSQIVQSVARSPDGSRLASASADRTVRIWDCSRNESVRELTGHADTVTAAAWSPDSALLATADYQGVVRLWNSETWEAIGMLKGHSAGIFQVAFSADGQQIVSTARRKDPRDARKFQDEAIVWNVATRQRVKDATVPPLFQSIPYKDCYFIPSGRAILKVSLQLDADERARRDQVLAPCLAFHREQMRLAENDVNWFAVRFHALRILDIEPTDTNAQFRLKSAESILNRRP